MIVNIPVAPGELIDKITILEIKRERIEDPLKLSNVEREYHVLSKALGAEISRDDELIRLRGKLKEINEALWKIEDDIRDHERSNDFGSRFIDLARAVYHTNDKRAQVKREINELLGSSLVEEKAYAKY